MNLRIQTYGQCLSRELFARRSAYIRATEGTTVYDALEKGLDDLIDLCDVVETKFTAARDAFAAEMAT